LSLVATVRFPFGFSAFDHFAEDCFREEERAASNFIRGMKAIDIDMMRQHRKQIELSSAHTPPAPALQESCLSKSSLWFFRPVTKKNFHQHIRINMVLRNSFWQQ